MKLLIITPHLGTGRDADGFARFVSALTRQIAAKRHQVTVLTGELKGGSGWQKAGRVTVIRSGNPRSGPLWAFTEYSRLVRLYPYDCVIEMSSGIPLLTPLYVNRPTVLLWAGQKPGNTGSFGKAGTDLIRRIIRSVYRSTGIVAVTSKSADILRESGVQAADSVLPTNPGGFARLVKHHRIPTLLVYNSQSSDSRTLIPAGLTGPSGIRRLRVNVIGNQPPVSSGSGKRRRADIRVAYFPNPSETERKRLLRESWAFVPYGSDSEEVWLAAEAAGYGVPVVSRDGTDLGGLITHDVNGLIAGPDNAAAGIRSVLTDGELRQRLSREAAAISRRNSIRHISRRVLRQISSAVRSRGSSQLGFRIIHTRPHYRPLDRMRAWYIKSVLSPQSLLDVGCGDGEFVSLLRGSGLAAWGIDTSRYMLSRSPARIRPYVRTGNIMSMDVADRSYDAVSCIDVLEHIPEKNIDRAIAECARVARWSIFFDITTLEDRAFVHADPTHVTKLHAQDWMQRIVSALKNDWSVRRPFMFPFVMNGLIIAQRKPVT